MSLKMGIAILQPLWNRVNQPMLRHLRYCNIGYREI